MISAIKKRKMKLWNPVKMEFTVQRGMSQSLANFEWIN